MEGLLSTGYTPSSFWWQCLASSSLKGMYNIELLLLACLSWPVCRGLYNKRLLQFFSWPVYSGQYPVIHAGRWRLVLKAGSANSQQAASLVLSKVENTHISYKEGYLIGIQIYLFLQLGLLVAFEPPPGDKTIEIITKYIWVLARYRPHMMATDIRTLFR